MRERTANLKMAFNYKSMNVIFTALLALLGMSIVYWLIQKAAEWIDSIRLRKWKVPEGMGTRKDGSPIFDHKGKIISTQTKE